MATEIAALILSHRAFVTTLLAQLARSAMAWNLWRFQVDKSNPVLNST